MKIITVVNIKGGCGKTQTASAMVGCLKQRGYKVLAVDLDYQANLTYIFNEMVPNPKHTIVDFMLDKCSFADVMRSKDGYDIIPADETLVNDDHVLSLENVDALSNQLNKYCKEYDYVIVDCPPSPNTITLSGVYAADECIIPAKAEYFSLIGAQQALKIISDINTYMNRSIKVNGILINMYDGRGSITKELRDMFLELAKDNNTRVYEKTIGKNIKIEEASSNQESIFTYKAKVGMQMVMTARKQYSEFVDAVLAGGEKGADE